MDLWDVEWIDADGTSLAHHRQLTEEAAYLQAHRWLQDHPGSRVYRYRRRGETSVLVQVLTADVSDCPTRTG
jgi:hypothetical protein